MAVLEWSDALDVGIGFMDMDHAEAADLINALAEAAPERRIPMLEEFIRHCSEHFAREEAMMDRVGFFAAMQHKAEHARVLAELDEVLKGLRAGQAQDEYFQESLPDWLINHRDTMDFVTAQYAQQQGFDDN